MKVSYKPLWHTLATKGIGKNQFRAESGISSSTYTKLVNDECTMTDTLLKIANYLKCDVLDIIEFVNN